MKHFLTSLGCCAVALSLFSFSADAALLKESKCSSRHHAGKRNVEANIDKKTNRALPPRRSTELEAHNWQNIGTGIFTDDVLTFAYWIDVNTYEVQVEQAADNTNLYRLVNPILSNPEKEAIEAEDGEFLTDKDYYIYFDVTDPNFVIIPRAELGFRDADGVAEFCSFTDYYEEAGFTRDEAMAYAGYFADNTISFPYEGATRVIQTEEDGSSHTYLSNYYGELKLVLPGGTDYSVKINNADGFCPDNDGIYHVTVNTGNVPKIRYGIFEDSKDEYVMQLINGGSECLPGETLSIDVNNFPERKAYLIIITLDDENMFRDGIYTTLYVPAENSEKWQYYCKGDFTDGLLTPYNFEEPVTIEVDVEQYADLPGYFRIKNPYQGMNNSEMQDSGHNHAHYIYLDASDPLNVIMQDSPVGVYGEYYGDILVGSDYYNMLLTFGKEILDDYGYESGGLFADNIITFNANAELAIYPTLFGDWFTTNVHEDGSAGDFCLVLKNSQVGVPVVTPTLDGTATYYDLRGMRVAIPTHGLFIERRDGTVRKVLIP